MDGFCYVILFQLAVFSSAGPGFMSPFSYRRTLLENGFNVARKLTRIRPTLLTFKEKTGRFAQPKSPCRSVTEATEEGQWVTSGGNTVWTPKACYIPEVKKSILDYPLGRIVFVGDSNTFRLSSQFRSYANCSGRTLNGGMSRCTFGKYLKVQTTQKWKPPIKGLEGPTAFGQSHPGCTDCSGCNGFWKLCKNKPKPVSFEYIPAEFAKDVEVQSTSLNTTQENVMDYLKRTGAPGVVVFNAGFHDLGYNNATAYKLNMLWYSKLYRKYFPDAKILFINTACAVNPKAPLDYKNITDNKYLKRFDNDTSDIMRSLNIPYIDNWSLTTKKYALEHFRLPGDRVHMSGSYYIKLIELIHFQFSLWFG